MMGRYNLYYLFAEDRLQYTLPDAVANALRKKVLKIFQNDKTNCEEDASYITKSNST